MPPAVRISSSGRSALTRVLGAWRHVVVYTTDQLSPRQQLQFVVALPIQRIGRQFDNPITPVKRRFRNPRKPGTRFHAKTPGGQKGNFLLFVSPPLAATLK